MISSIAWVKRGLAKRFPDHSPLTEEEYRTWQERCKSLGIEVEEETFKTETDHEETKEIEPSSDPAEMETDEGSFSPSEKKESKDPLSTDTTKAVKNVPTEPKDALSIYHLDDYDKEEDSTLSIFGRVNTLIQFPSNEEDPYMTMTRDSEEEAENEDLEIFPSDRLVLAARAEEDVCVLEVYVYEAEEDNLYVHHDLMLSSYPLCVEWLDFDSQVRSEIRGNFVAVGTFDPWIEIWDLDILSPLLPKASLGTVQESVKPTKKERNDPCMKLQQHLDAVLTLNWNGHHRNLLASGSADKTVKLWDLTTQKCLRSYHHHTSKVQAVQWHPQAQYSTVLVTGAFDHTVAVLDTRQPQARRTFQVSSNVESIRWNPHHDYYFAVSTEDGRVQYFDDRTMGGKGSEKMTNRSSSEPALVTKPVFELHAHDQETTAIDFHPTCNILLTGSTDKTVKLWDMENDHPHMLCSRFLGGDGRVLTAKFCPDDPFVIAIGTDKGKVKVWNAGTNVAYRRRIESNDSIPNGSLNRK